ncbi:choline dehydrogenase [Colletotrichum incanum]|uniref:Choline dehydrogenase n=1 Tax=Colletotrichum incanum TaxID=1573173 RepID=A0A166WFU1_COLIC|nr:choline dehydrogenase [Colletotrichum incanum]
MCQQQTPADIQEACYVTMEPQGCLGLRTEFPVQATQIIGRLCQLILFVFLLLSPVASAPAQSAADGYDYIVIGSGPGGGLIAVNLAKAGYSVLILEAGDSSVASGGGQYPPSITWDFFVKHYEEDERNKKNNFVTWRARDGSYWVGNKNVPSDAKLLGIYHPRGATVGGSSMINAMATLLPTDSD